MFKKYAIKPFSENIIFLDTEFSTLDPYQGEILSVGLVKLNGEELYLELEYDGPISDWVKENIISTLSDKKVSREEAKKKIKEFVGNQKPYMVSYVNQYDAVYLYKLFQGDENPFFWLPIDFASFMFSVGENPEPENYYEIARNLGINVESYKLHNALDDAKLLREIYLNFLK